FVGFDPFVSWQRGLYLPASRFALLVGLIQFGLGFERGLLHGLLASDLFGEKLLVPVDGRFGGRTCAGEKRMLVKSGDALLACLLGVMPVAHHFVEHAARRL